ncbi:hypothetical protein ACH492_27790 [Streptomyces sp. NPDC019443]|uniref:hypothetical protein n=1 Tax=Streptomyces sp. NPDC019443 TaxID=3365061 RepID=UPI0037B595E8
MAQLVGLDGFHAVEADEYGARVRVVLETADEQTGSDLETNARGLDDVRACGVRTRSRSFQDR